MEKEELEKVVEAAQKAYDGAKGTDEERREKYLVARELIWPRRKELVAAGLGGPAFRTWGWAAYYLGNLANPNWKKMEIKDPAYYKEATRVWIEGLQLTPNDVAVRISILNGLPLSTRWIYPGFDRTVAFSWSDQGIEEAIASGKPELVASTINTRNILLREEALLKPWKAKEALKEAAEGCQKVYQVAFQAGALRTAGHGQQNLGDTYVLMIHNTKNPLRRIALVIKAFCAYRRARGCYVNFEKKTGEKTATHYQAATKKMLAVIRELFK